MGRLPPTAPRVSGTPTHTSRHARRYDDGAKFGSKPSIKLELGAAQLAWVRGVEDKVVLTADQHKADWFPGVKPLPTAEAVRAGFSSRVFKDEAGTYPATLRGAPPHRAPSRAPRGLSSRARVRSQPQPRPRRGQEGGPGERADPPRQRRVRGPHARLAGRRGPRRHGGARGPDQRRRLGQEQGARARAAAAGRRPRATPPHTPARPTPLPLPLPRHTRPARRLRLHRRAAQAKKLSEHSFGLIFEASSLLVVKGADAAAAAGAFNLGGVALADDAEAAEGAPAGDEAGGEPALTDAALGLPQPGIYTNGLPLEW